MTIITHFSRDFDVGLLSFARVGIMHRYDQPNTHVQGHRWHVSLVVNRRPNLPFSESREA